MFIAKDAYRERFTTSTPHPRIMSSASPSPVLRAGLEQGFDQSPITRLRTEFQEEHETTSSTHTRAIALASKKTLLSSDVIDRGPNRPNDTPRYHLIPDLYLDLHKTASELQFYLQSMAGLVPGRNTYFTVDPRNTFLTILNGAHDLAQLHAAWMGVSKRMELGIKYISKYESEYLESDIERRIQSPISTNPGIIENLTRVAQPDERMRFL